MMSIRILAVITLSLFANIVNAKIVISGHVVNEDNEPIDVATTKLVDGEGKMLYFQITAQLQISVAYFCSIGLYFLV